MIKFDDTLFYRDYFNRFPGSKGIDFVSVSPNQIAFIEVKTAEAMRVIADGELHRITRKRKQPVQLLILQEEIAWILK